MAVTNKSKKRYTKRPAKKKAVQKEPEEKPRVSSSIKTEAVIIGVLAFSVLIALSVFTESVGVLGAVLGNLFFATFGIGAVIMPFAAILGCVFAGFKKFKRTSRFKNTLVLIIFFAFISVVHVLYKRSNEIAAEGLSEHILFFAENGGADNGGIIGALIGGGLAAVLSTTGALVVLGAVIIICGVVITERSMFELLSTAAHKTADTAKKINFRREPREQTGFDDVKAAKRPFSREDISRIKSRVSGNDKNYNIKLNWADGSEGDLSGEDYEKLKSYVEENPELFGFAREEDDAPPFETSQPVETTAETPAEPLFEEAAPVLFEQNAIDNSLDDAYGADIIFEDYEQDKPLEAAESLEAVEIADDTQAFDDTPPFEITEFKQKTNEGGVTPVTPVREPQKVSQSGFIDYTFPPYDLLQTAVGNVGGNSRELMTRNAQKLEETLKSFGVIAKVVQINEGPTVTRYELKPDSGVKVSKIVGLADDIALNLASNGIRIEAPVPGKSVVGIEVPNANRAPVLLRDVLEAREFQQFGGGVAFGVGKDIGGTSIVADIADMPHLLIAGATGAGKSVCINTMIVSILYKASPNEVKLILIDPKVVELGVYDGIPHLLRSVVTDPKEAANALNWGVREMNNRYNLFKEENVRDLKGFNNTMAEKFEFDRVLPKIIIVIDELSDLMMTAPKDVEDSIMRLAQKARAAGIHLVLATQRPSVDVITGVIKANIPSRLAFAVSSGTDSRTILDMVGAEKLLGRGDMLFNPRDLAKPVRIQGAFVSDKEVERIVDYVKEHSEVEYDEQIAEEIINALKTPVGGASANTDDGGDDLYDEILEFVMTKKEVSVSMLQRQFRIGYNRAARVVDTLERNGVVSANSGESGKPSRKVLANNFEE